MPRCRRRLVSGIGGRPLRKSQELSERDLSQEDIIAIFLDGKTFAEETLVLTLGLTLTGEKLFLGCAETNTENEKVLAPFLSSLVEPGLDLARGMWVIIDGGKGPRAAVQHAFQRRRGRSWRAGRSLEACSAHASTPPTRGVGQRSRSAVHFHGSNVRLYARH